MQKKNSIIKKSEMGSKNIVDSYLDSYSRSISSRKMIKKTTMELEKKFYTLNGELVDNILLRNDVEDLVKNGSDHVDT